MLDDFIGQWRRLLAWLDSPIRLHSIAGKDTFRRANQQPPSNQITFMKSTIALIALALVATVSGTAFAGDYGRNSYNNNSYGNSYSNNSYGRSYDRCETPRYEPKYEAPRYEPTYCKPYKVSTCEVSRCRECRTAYDHCGKPYTYHVTIITYRDTYSDGSFKTYTAQS
jgi:hypothetical protein